MQERSLVFDKVFTATIDNNNSSFLTKCYTYIYVYAKKGFNNKKVQFFLRPRRTLDEFLDIKLTVHC